MSPSSDRERHAVAIGDARARRRADALAGGDDAGEVERIGGADGEDPSGRLACAALRADVRPLPAARTVRRTCRRRTVRRESRHVLRVADTLASSSRHGAAFGSRVSIRRKTMP